MSDDGSKFALGYLVGEQMSKAAWETGRELHANNMARETRRAAFETEQTLAIALKTIDTLKARLAETERRLALEQCSAEGLAAMVDAYKAENTGSRLAKSSGYRYKNGQEKTIGRVEVFEPAFRRHAQEIGISIPEGRLY